MDLPPPAIEQSAEAVAPLEDRRSYARQDGTLVIDILVEPPCGESSEREIVVCARGETAQRYAPPDPRPAREPANAEIQLSENSKIGLDTQPGRDGAVEAVVKLTIKF